MPTSMSSAGWRGEDGQGEETDQDFHIPATGNLYLIYFFQAHSDAVTITEMFTSCAIFQSSKLRNLIEIELER